MSQLLFLTFLGSILTTLLVVEINGVCEDIDTIACADMISKGLMCNDPVLSKSACPLSCGLCGRACYSCQATASNVSACATTTCHPGDMCLLKTKTSANHEETYTLGCGPSLICSKKRDVSYIEERDIHITCCSGNLCNIPDVKPTVQTTTAKPRGCIKDFILMVEDSTSLAPYFPIIKIAVKAVLDTMDFDTDGTRVGVATFHGSHCTTRWELDRYSNKTDLYKAVDGLQAHPEGSANGYNAIAVEYLVENFRQGNRPDVPDVILFNSQSNLHLPSSSFLLSNGHTETDALQFLHHKSESVIVIAFGNADQAEMRQIASDNKHYLYIPSVVGLDPNAFQQSLSAIISLTCSS
ncbi:hypothetical protein ACF0H5_022925 [Mactra antiquata]